MRRSIAIIGAGQAGLQLGIDLLKRPQKHAVSIFTNRSAEQILKGRIMSSQGMFDSALRHERRLRLNFWDQSCPQNKAVSFTLAQPGAAKKMIAWSAATRKPYQSVDQRLKFSYWMREFEKLGGKIHVQDVGLTELNQIAKWHELTIVAGGKGEISQSFPKDLVRSHFDKPQRALSCLYAKGVIADQLHPGVHANILPGIGEFFIMPGLTLDGPCEMLLFEGLPNGPFDCWKNIKDPQEQLQIALDLLKKHIPWESERCEQITLSDPQATLIGQYAPIVRHPTFKLPCGKSVLGIGDTVVLNDPIAGQGANNAAKAAAMYADRIDSHDEKEFDESWMQETFEECWQHSAKWSTKWTHTLLMPPAPYIIDLLKAASTSDAIASVLANGFDDPITLFPWITSAEDVQKLIHDIQQKEKVTQEEESRLYSYGYRP